MKFIDSNGAFSFINDLHIMSTWTMYINILFGVKYYDMLYDKEWMLLL